MKYKVIKLLQKVKTQIYYHGFLSKCNCRIERVQDKNALDIVTIAFNNHLVINHQIRLLRRFLMDKFHLLVADNSSDVVMQEKIYNSCKQEGVSYLRLPPNPYNGVDSSRSHAAALNWIYKHYIINRCPSYFGFLDHDIFPIRKTYIVQHLQKYPVWGLVQQREHMWYIWPGLCFFNYEHVAKTTIDFMPTRGGDTNSGNWEHLYSKLNRSQLPILSHTYSQIRPGNDPQSDMVELIGDWLHTFNASCWKYIDRHTDKEELINDILNSL